MTVKTLRLRNFRNYGLLEIEFSDRLNILYGENAQGKTNVLEAVFLCSTGRSHRTQKDAEMIKFGEGAAIVELEMERENYGLFRIEIEIKRTGRKSIVINGVPQRRAGDLLGRLNCAMFSPEDLGIVKDEPQVRRRFLDMFISQIKPAYYFNLHRYLGALRQRNALLRQACDNPRLLDSIGAWDSQLVEFGSKVMQERILFVDRIGENAKAYYSLITNGREGLAVAYDPSVKAERESIGVTYAAALESGLKADLARMTTQCGPHKDDIACSVDGRNLRLYGSQGQQRTAALALKMAQVDVMAGETGDSPVLLLDDVMSELDRGRQENLSANMKSAQTFITGTERYSPVNPAGGTSCFYVEGGQILAR
jgi:DNA replication and repair protein RecF